MKLTKIFLSFISFIIISCEKPNPHPESIDPIYADMQKDLDDTKKAVEEERKNLEEQKKELDKVVPQTGQIRYAQKRLYESEHKLSRLEQQAKYLEILLESRKKSVKKSYMKAWNKKEHWPNPKEYQEYLDTKKAMVVPPVWSVERRIEEAGLGKKQNKKPAESHGESHDDSAKSEGH